MEHDQLGKLLASFCIISFSSMVLYHSCLRASTIYFFELDTVNVVFVTKRHAVIFPLVFSVVLYFVYLGTKRSVERKEQQEKLIQKQKLARARSSLTGSRKISHTEDSSTTRKTSFSYADESMAEQARRLKRLLSDIEEQDTVQSQKAEPSEDPIVEEEMEPVPAIPPRFTIEKIDEPKVIVPENDPDTQMRSRSQSNRSQTKEQQVNKSPVKEPVPPRKRSIDYANPIFTTELSSGSSVSGSGGAAMTECFDENESLVEEGYDIYKQLGDSNLLMYTLSALNLLPSTSEGSHVSAATVNTTILDMISEVFAVHLPVWGCVVALYIVLLELFTINLSYSVYYHATMMNYTALALALAFGLVHEWNGNWVTNNVLAFASVYVVTSRCQAVSYQTAVVFVVGMALFDLFWLFGVDVLTTITRQFRAPFMILCPRNFEGDKECLATLDVMVPGVFLNVVLKYSSMYDPGLFDITFYASFISLLCTMLFAILRHKVTPAMVLPAVLVISVSLCFATHRRDLWRFMIRH